MKVDDWLKSPWEKPSWPSSAGILAAGSAHMKIPCCTSRTHVTPSLRRLRNGHTGSWKRSSQFMWSTHNMSKIALTPQLQARMKQGIRVPSQRLGLHSILILHNINFRRGYSFQWSYSIYLPKESWTPQIPETSSASTSLEESQNTSIDSHHLHWIIVPPPAWKRARILQ